MALDEAIAGPALINWLRLEDLVARACELEVRAFGNDHPQEAFYACCLEFDGFDGSLDLAYGTRPAVDALAEEAAGDPSFCYRAAELQPEYWHYRATPRLDPEGYWAAAEPILGRYRGVMAGDPEDEVAEFNWLRFEYLTECVVRRLGERDAFRYIPRDPEFLAYSLCREERLEALEDRIAKLYPAYNRATMELVNEPRRGDTPDGLCAGNDCGREFSRAELNRCTQCQSWFCEVCAGRHGHPELARRQRLFLADS